MADHKYRVQVRDNTNRTWRKPNHMTEFWHGWENARAEIRTRASKAGNISFGCEFRVVQISDEHVMYGPVLSTASGAKLINDEGGTTLAVVSPTYQLQWKRGSSPDWNWFDNNRPKEYTLEGARQRIARCSFTVRSTVRISRVNPFEVIFEQAASQSSLEAWINNFTDNRMEAPQMDYEARKPLHIPTETLIEKIQANIDEKKAKFEEAEQKQLDANMALVERLRVLVEEAPGSVLVALKNYIGTYEGGPLDVKTDDEAAVKRIKGDYPAPGSAEFTADPAATKLVSVLSAATDEVIEVTPSDDFYSYL